MHWYCTTGIQILRQVTFQKCDGIVLKNVQDITLRDGIYDHIYGFRVYIQWLLIPPVFLTSETISVAKMNWN